MRYPSQKPGSHSFLFPLFLHKVNRQVLPIYIIDIPVTSASSVSATIVLVHAASLSPNWFFILLSNLPKV